MVPSSFSSAALRIADALTTTASLALFSLGIFRYWSMQKKYEAEKTGSRALTAETAWPGGPYRRAKKQLEGVRMGFLRVNEAVPELFGRAVPTVEQGTFTVIAGTLLDVPRREVLLISTADGGSGI